MEIVKSRIKKQTMKQVCRISLPKWKKINPHQLEFLHVVTDITETLIPFSEKYEKYFLFSLLEIEY